MTTSERTPNPGTTTKPGRSSKRVAHKSPFGWLPWALLGLLALLVALVFLVINAVDDDGPPGPAGDQLGQLGSSGGSGINGADGNSGAGTTVPRPQTDPGTSGGTAGGTANAVEGLTAAGLVGGAGITAAPASADAATLAKRESGTAGTVLFAEGSADLDTEADKVVDAAVKGLQSAGATSVTVSGYTDVVAGQDVNDPLSQQRADAVAGALKAALPNLQTTTEALGPDSPVASNDTEAGRQQNRRVSIVAAP